jgi:hypothetical protein
MLRNQVRDETAKAGDTFEKRLKTPSRRRLTGVREAKCFVIQGSSVK